MMAASAPRSRGPVIAVALNEGQKAVGRRLRRALLEAGAGRVVGLTGTVVPEGVDGVVLPGGEEAIQDPACETRRRVFALLDGLARHVPAPVPVLGICQGMELLCLWSGVRRLQPVTGRRRTTGAVWAAGEKTEGVPVGVVTMNHEWCVRRLPRGWQGVHWAVDAEGRAYVASMVHRRRPWTAVQWHPERPPLGGHKGAAAARRLPERPPNGLEGAAAAFSRAWLQAWVRTLSPKP